MSTSPDDRITLRFMSEPGDTAAGGRSVAAGSVMEWIDKAGYACAVGWAGAYCVTAYVGNVRHRRPIAPGSLIEVRARIIHTGRTSMHVVVTVSSSEVSAHAYTPATTCMLIFVAKGADGRPAGRAGVDADSRAPTTSSPRPRSSASPARTEIKRLMLDEEYTDAGEAPRTTLRFLVPPGVVNWGGKAHGGTVMRWIDEAAVRVRGLVGERRRRRERGDRGVLGRHPLLRAGAHRRPRRGRRAAHPTPAAQHAHQHPGLDAPTRARPTS